jgi:pimeloyl-ACP methyl ester carboxylesterase
MKKFLAKHKRTSRTVLAASVLLGAMQSSAAPPALKESGSFFVNGEVIHTDNPGGGIPGGRMVVNQMYVEYAIPQNQKAGAWPVIMVHGSGHTGKTYDTTPDGRDGWKQHFLRKGYSVYIVDQVGRARSGWNATPINNAESKADTRLLPKGGIVQFTYESAWLVFRFGPKPDVWWPDSKFPKASLDQYMAQLVPNTEATLPQPQRQTVDAMVELLKKIGPAMVIVHSQSGIYGTLAALARPDLVKAVLNVEGRVGCELTPEQISVMAKVPWLNIGGDHGWNGEEQCRKAVAAVNAAGGTAGFLATYEKGVRGNTHMMMMDLNNLQVADWILSWVEKNVAKQPLARANGGRINNPPN